MKIYVVKKGDTLYFISQKHNVSIEEILKLNPAITNPDVLDVGMKLKIPSTTGGTGGMDIMHQHVVKQGDTLWKLSKAWGVPLADMIKANPQLKNPNVLLTGEIVNIPKSGTGNVEIPGGGVNETSNGGGMHPLHPMSIMHGVQGLVGKKPTGQIPTQTSPAAGKTPTGPITGKTPTAPIEKQTAPVANTPMPKPTVKPNVPAVEPKAVKPNTKTLPIEKPVENKVLPSQAENKPNVDLFKQFNIPATEAVSPVTQKATYNGYGYSNPSVSPVQTGTGYGGWAQPMPFGANVSPISENAAGHFICPPGMMPVADVHGYGYGYGYGHYPVSPANVGPETYGYSYGHGMISPLNEGPETYGYGYGHHGMVSPANDCNNGEVSPAGWGPEAYNHGYGYGHGMVSPANVGPEAYGHGYGYGYHPNQVSPVQMGPNAWPQSIMSENSANSVLGTQTSPNANMWPQSVMSENSSNSVLGTQTGPNANMWPQSIMSENSANSVLGTQTSPNANMWPQSIMSENSANSVLGTQTGPNANMWPQSIMSENSANSVLGTQTSPNANMWPQSIMPLAVSPNSVMPTQTWPNSVLPAEIGPNAGWPAQVSPVSQGNGYGYGQVSPANTGPQGYGYGQVSPANVGPQGYGYGQVSPANAGPQGYGYGHGYPAWGFPQFQPSPAQTAGAAEKPCGCKDKRDDEETAKVEGAEAAKSKIITQRKGGKKAVIRTVAARSRQSKRNSQPWINR